MDSLEQNLDQILTIRELKARFGDHLPKHVGLVLDGNRRWIRKQGIKDVTKGHLAGYQRLKKILYYFFEGGIHYLTAYALSIENVRKRSPEEVRFLFSLILKGVDDVLSEPLIHEKKVRVRLIGHLNELPSDIQIAIEKMNEATKDYHDNFINFCVMYDGQEEIVDAVRKIISDRIPIDKITRDVIKQHLYTKDFPELDYLIRTGMEDGQRISGFLIWDSSYAEFRFRTDLWPDYDEKMILEDLKEYVRRNRRLGA
jgi:tritrans,polycis-undecaprenyl-diphosphate synthase [geranylgeranyl-diphosphate specific]